MAASILITGASGFIGSFIVQEALRREYRVWAGVRQGSSKRFLRERNIHFLKLDFSRPDEVRAQLSAHKSAYGAFDHIIHCAGVTKTTDKEEFDRVNYRQTKCFIDTLTGLDMVPAQFIFLSSLSVFGPIHEKDYAPIRESDRPAPNTIYGMSKLKAERYIEGIPGFPYIIYRPTGVYGPRDRDYLLLARTIKSHLDISAGFRRQDLTFIYVKDLVKAIFLGIDRNVTQRSYFLSDGNAYPSRFYSELVRKELGNPFVFHIKCPLFVLKAISLLAQFVSGCLGTTSALNSDKYNIMKQRNWRCDISPAVEELGFTPGYSLEEGVKETIAWYRNEGWL
ncbi:MAG: NAD(P)-dependent oxidoreductase [Mediterranea sp.]|jgi:UDP-glucose 4-epimerase|nr:NAD(P)-dependent oxidoreductase [Mediterranea sp.]